MTQFVLVKAKKSCTALVSLEELDNNFFRNVAKKLFPNFPTNEICILNVEGKDIDQLILESQKKLIYSEFESTDLYRAIKEVALASDELVLWYGSDYEDLDYIDNTSDLFKEIESTLRSPICELYLHFKHNQATHP